MQVTVWRLTGPVRITTRAVVVRGEDNRWELRVEQGDAVIHSEQHQDLDAALARAKTMWIACEQGYPFVVQHEERFCVVDDDDADPAA